MIRKSLVVIATVLVTAFASYKVSKSINNSSTELSKITLFNLEALGSGESVCITSSSKNTGVCKAKVDGTGDSCVTAGFWDVKNCKGDL